MAAMTPDARDAFLREPRIAKLVHLLPDGSPTAVPVWFEWDGRDALVFTSRRSTKIGRLARDPRVALSVETAVGEAEAWVTVEGNARVEEGGWELAQRLAPRYYDEAKAASALAAWSRLADDWVVIRVIPVRIRSSA